MTRPVTMSELTESVARRMLSDMEEHGSIEDFYEKLLGFPEQYLTELAVGAIDAVALCDCLHPRVQR